MYYLPTVLKAIYHGLMDKAMDNMLSRLKKSAYCLYTAHYYDPYIPLHIQQSNKRVQIPLYSNKTPRQQ